MRQAVWQRLTLRERSPLAAALEPQFLQEELRAL
jgi:hypothetical protein